MKTTFAKLIMVSCAVALGRSVNVGDYLADREAILQAEGQVGDSGGAHTHTFRLTIRQ